MEEGLKEYPLGFHFADRVCAFESSLCKQWIEAIFNELKT
jgi:hypothetical protein